jgi:hypothetical protein
MVLLLEAGKGAGQAHPRWRMEIVDSVCVVRRDETSSNVSSCLISWFRLLG